MSENDGRTGNTEIGSLAVAIVALVVALVALLGTTAQVFQQYLATAVGYSNCGKRVMGPWARHTKLVFHPWELRFEVVFRSPDITIEPLRPGEVENVNDMKSWDVEEPTLYRQQPLDEKNVIADYSATWLVLLSTARSMLREGGSPTGSHGDMVSVKVQARLQTLDLMPEGVKKPYATTTLSSIVVLAGMLGLHWKQFDRINDRYVADGNGLLFTGFSVPHLGIMFTFTRHGTPWFPPMTRIIPTAGLFEYCFGLVPTIFRASDASRPTYLTDVPPDLGTLRLGSPAEIGSTLASLQCDRHIIQFLGSTEHIFPVLFEIVGMLGRPMHVRGVAGRTLPNPLPYRWDDKTFSLGRLLAACAAKIQGLVGTSSFLAEDSGLINMASSLQAPSFRLLPTCDVDVLNKLHDIVDWCDGRLELWDPESQKEILTTIQKHIDIFWGSLLRVKESAPDSYRSSSNLDHVFRSLNYPNQEHQEGNLIDIYFSTVIKSFGGDLSPPEARFFTGEPKRLHIWLVLMLRMVCWLKLHTFHAADVQLPKSDLMGTRLPVYIS